MHKDKQWDLQRCDSFKTDSYEISSCPLPAIYLENQSFVADTHLQI